MATTKSRASRGADKADQDQPEREPLGAAGMRANEPEPAGPYAEVGAEEVHIPFYRPSVQVVAAGLTGPETIETITCEHPWAHTTPEIAAKCGRKLAASRGLRVRTAE